MLDTDTKRRIDTARDILVGKVPDPKSQVEQVTIALIYKFMDDMDAESEELGGKRKFFTGDYARYGWARLMAPSLGGHEMLGLYSEGISKMPENPGIPALFRDIFKNAYLPYRDPETLRAFLKIIDEFSYDHSERLGDAFEYLLSVLGSQGDAGQFRTPRHIIDFMVEVLAPQKHETILDPACGTAGFLISAYKFILRANTSGRALHPTPTPSPLPPLPVGEGNQHYRGGYEFAGLVDRARELRQKQTEAESFLWELLRDRKLCDAKFRRQHQFGDYICDFYCHDAALVVECDGAAHDSPERQAKDAARDAYLKSQGLTVLRFLNHDVLTDTPTVLEKIATHLRPPSTSEREEKPFAASATVPSSDLPSTSGRGAGGEGVGRPGDLLTPDERGRLAKNLTGYDISPDMVRLSLVNLYLHGFTDPHVYEYDTLTSEDRWHEFADVILANPPFMSPKGGIKPHKRFGIQAKRSEVLFVDYMAEHLTPTGRAAIIVPEGIIFQSQTAYKQLRKMLVENSLVAVVSLPAGCFQPYSGVKTSILILDKSLARQSPTVGFFKVENDGFGLGAQRRAIEKNDLPQVQADLAAYLAALRSGEPSPAGRGQGEGASSLIVAKEKLAANGDYNLSGERYREGAASNHSFPLVFLGDESLFRVESGGTPKSDVEEYWGGGIPWATLVDLPATDFISEITTTKRTISDKGLRESSAKMIPANSVVVSTRATIGRIAINRVPIATNQGFKNVVIEDLARAVPDFVALALTKLVPTMEAWATGGTFAEISKSKFCELQIPLPPLEVQKEIVAEIVGYQKVIKRLKAEITEQEANIQNTIARVWGEDSESANGAPPSQPGATPRESSHPKP